MICGESWWGNHQLLGSMDWFKGKFTGKLWKTPIFNGKITLVSCRFSLKSIHWLVVTGTMEWIMTFQKQLGRVTPKHLNFYAPCSAMLHNQRVCLERYGEIAKPWWIFQPWWPGGNAEGPAQLHSYGWYNWDERSKNARKFEYLCI